MSAPVGRSIGELFSDLAFQFQRLIRTEFLLARAEIGENLRKVGGAGFLIVAGALIVLPGLTVLLQGIALLLMRARLSPDIATLIAGGFAFVLGILVVSAGTSRLKNVNLIPEKTLIHLQRDVAAVNPARRKDEHAAA